MMTPLEAASAYIARGWNPVPLPFKKKRPVGRAWPQRKINASNVARFFNGGQQNVGVQLGPSSNNLTDCDLDCAEALIIAPVLLPRTGAIFGRASAPGSHRLYYSALAETIGKAALQFKDPTLVRGKADEDDKAMLLELRVGGGGRGAQSVFPGSVHPTGEAIEWADDGGGDPAQANGATLENTAKRTAAACLFARYWPHIGGRHDAGLCLGGFLARCGFNEVEALRLAETIAKAAGADAAHTKRCVGDCVRDYRAGVKTIYGLPALIDTFGEKVARRCAEWLDYNGRNEDYEAPVEPQGDLPADASLADFVAYLPRACFVYMPTREFWPGESVNVRLPKVKTNRREITPARWLAKHRAAEQMTWAPGLPDLIRGRLVADGGWIEKKGVTCFNLYRPPVIEPGDADRADPWLDHVHKVFPGEAEHIIRYLAHRRRHPEEKINHALVLGGSQGIGKDTILAPIKHAVGYWNFAEVKPRQVIGRFNGFLKSTILRINEAKDLGEVDRFEFYDHMKDYIASPPDTLCIDEKNLREHMVMNCCGVIIGTNYKTTGIYLPSDDRRHFVAWSELIKSSFSGDYWTMIYNWYEREGNRHVTAYLDNLNLSGFDPKASPPKTQAWWDIIDANRAPEDAELADALDTLKSPDAVTLEQLKRVATSALYEWLDNRRNWRVIPHRLDTCDYMPFRNPDAKDGQWKIGGTRQTVYVKKILSLQDRHKAARALGGK